MFLEDYNETHWKSRFIGGLPNLFTERIHKKFRDQNLGKIKYENYIYGYLINFVTQERIRKKLRDQNLGKINYENYTYGYLINFVTQGVTLYNELKLQRQLKKQNLTKRKGTTADYSAHASTCSNFKFFKSE